MAKFFLQDVKVKRKPKTADRAPNSIWPESKTLQPKIREVKNQKKNSRYALWLVVVVSVVFLFFALSYLFSKATVTINPKVQDMVLKESLSAGKGGNGNVLPFDLVIISGEESKIVPTAEAKDISQKAEGVVLIYNAFSSNSQLLSIDTRLEGSNGKIYKTKKALVVPGMKNGAPGFIEAGVYGAETGEEYNSGPLDFTIFGFKGTPKYSKFYGRSKGEITGGLKGKFPVIPESQKTAVINELKETLQAKLFEKVADQIPDGFILFKNAIFFDIDGGDNIDYVSFKDKMLPLKIRGTLYGFLFDENKLTKKIAENNITQYDGSAVYLPNIQNLTFSWPAGQVSLFNENSVSLENIKNINFNLAGAAKIVWKFEADKLTADLLGQPKENFSQILLRYPNVSSADLVVSPFWKTSIPDEMESIKVIVNYPE